MVCHYKSHKEDLPGFVEIWLLSSFVQIWLKALLKKSTVGTRTTGLLSSTYKVSYRRHRKLSIVKKDFRTVRKCVTILALLQLDELIGRTA
jgi:hypothetical protein